MKIVTRPATVANAWLLVQPLVRIGMSRDPVACDVEAAGDPNVLVLHHVVEQTLEAGRAGRMAAEPHVEPDRHHLRLLGALAVEHVEGIADKGEPRVRGSDPAGVLAVVVDQRIGNDEVGLAADGLPERKLVAVVVGIIEKSPFLRDEPAGIDAGSVAAIPAQRPLADYCLERSDGFSDMLALLVFGQLRSG